MSHTPELFHWESLSRLVTADVSDLGPTPFQFIEQQQKYGLIVVSPMSGEGSIWIRTSTEIDAEGDVRAWHLVPTKETVERVPILKGYKMVVFND